LALDLRLVAVGERLSGGHSSAHRADDAQGRRVHAGRHGIGKDVDVEPRRAKLKIVPERRKRTLAESENFDAPGTFADPRHPPSTLYTRPHLTAGKMPSNLRAHHRTPGRSDEATDLSEGDGAGRR